MRRTARRYSLCADDADDALQRGLEILLRKAPSDDPHELVKWTQTVVKHEALAIRQERERILAGPAAAPSAGREDWVSLLPASSDGPAESVERRETIARSREALRALKPHELRALTLLAEGYSYLEIGEITGYSHTKINRCLAEGRERFRKLISRSEDGSRCAEMQPLISAFCDGEAKPAEVSALREHLRACAHCRATLRTYRAAPAAAAALAPALPLARSLLGRAHDALANLATRFSGGSGSASQAAMGSGAGGTGAAVFVKAAAVCIGTAGGAAACIAGGLVPAPLDLNQHQDQPPALERRVADTPPPEATTPEVEYAPAPEPAASKPQPKHSQQQPPEEAEPATNEPSADSFGAVEYTPPPAPEPTSEPVVSESSEGNPAGEFGP